MARPFKVGSLYRTSLEIFALFPKIPPRKYDHSIYKCTRGGVQKSSIGNHCHPNLFCGMRAPSLVISTTSIGNQTKKGIIKSFIFLEKKTILTSVNGLWCTIFLQISLLPLSFENISMPHEELEIELRFLTFVYGCSSIINEALEIIIELNTSF